MERNPRVEQELRQWKTYRTISYVLRALSVISGTADDALVKILMGGQGNQKHPFDDKIADLNHQIPIDVEARPVTRPTKQENEATGEEETAREESMGKGSVRKGKKGKSTRDPGF